MYHTRVALVCALILLVAAANCTVVHAAPSADESNTLAVSAENTYYVAKNGNNSNDGSILHPWKTISKAANTVVAGSTVYVRNGTYREQVVVQNSGTPGQYITFDVYPGEEVTIDGTGIILGNWQGLVHIEGKDYIKFSGFRVVDSSSMGFLLCNSSHVIIKNNYIHNTNDSAVLACDGSHYSIDGNEIESVQNLPGPFDPYSIIQEIISIQGSVDTFEVCNNHIHHCASINSKEGIDAKNGVSNGKIYNNHVHHVVSVGIYVDAWDRYAKDIEVYNNVVHDMWVRSGAGFGVSAEAGGVLENVTLYNNIAYNNRQSGIMIPTWGYGTLKNISVVNNLCIGNGNFGVDVGQFDTTIQGVLIRNNICSNNTGGQIYVEEKPAVKGVIIDHNLIDGFRDNPGETKGTCFMEGDPLFADPAHADFHLSSSSPAIDTGSAVKAPKADLDGNRRPKGRGYDIGPFELARQDESEYLSVLIPNGCDTWKQGTAHTIRWTFNGTPGPFVKVVLVKGGVNKYTIADNVPVGVKGLGSLRWTIPSSQSPGSDYTIRVISTSNSTIGDMSNAPFTIKPSGSIVVTSPNGGEFWQRGMLQTIKWKYTGKPGSTVKIQILNGTTVSRQITKSTPLGTNGSGSFQWLIPSKQPVGTKYTIQITSTTDSSKRDVSDTVFSIG